ncbi:MAG: molybdate ABC transporter substrate-binding protein [Treponema sp.]|nr:molybdate ABC transporter substrate-binding protein [Treponema sp.]
MKKNIIILTCLSAILILSFLGCSRKAKKNEVEIQVFIAASLNRVMTQLAADYREVHPEVKITFNADSSGKLMTQILEGYSCDIFFSAAQNQMNSLEKAGLLIEGSRKNVLNNQLILVALKDSKTSVTSLENLEEAKNLALAAHSVPAGKYTRNALIKLGKIKPENDGSKITTEEVSKALGNVEISEQSNVSKVLNAVAEGSCEVGAVYYSDFYGYEDKLRILQFVPQDLTGNIIYPISQVKNSEATEAQVLAAKDFLDYVVKSKDFFKSYYFEVDF